MFIFDYRLAITKLDVLDQLAEIKIAVAYKYNGEILDSYPGNVVGDNNFDKLCLKVNKVISKRLLNNKIELINTLNLRYPSYLG